MGGEEEGSKEESGEKVREERRGREGGVRECREKGSGLIIAVSTQCVMLSCPIIIILTLYSNNNTDNKIISKWKEIVYGQGIYLPGVSQEWSPIPAHMRAASCM